MSIAYMSLNYPFVTAISSSYGVSDESNSLQDSIKDIQRRHSETASGQGISRVSVALLEIFLDCRKPNWDGYDAKPISEKAYFEAAKLLELLRFYLPQPEIVPEPMGDIAFEWYKENQYTFVISVSGVNTIAYAGIFGPGNEVHGTENFTESIPRTIIENIQRLFPSET